MMKNLLTSLLLMLTLNASAEVGLFDNTFCPPADSLKVKFNEKPLNDVSWSGIPMFLAGMIIKGEKETFRQNYDNAHVQARLVSSFKTEVDDYLQYFGPAMTLGLKLSGMEGRSDWLRLLTSAAATYAIEASVVNSIKYTTSELRPDGSTRNSWPSGHTATAFAGVTILHKEYGLTRSPWFSVLGYGVATSTAVMRVLNNRHWVSDVFSGAGVGIMAGELGYFIGDVIFKEKGLLRNDMADFTDLQQRPSFFGLSMDIGLGSHHLDFENAIAMPDQVSDIKLKFQMATVVGAEGAYFLTKHVGVGGRLRVSTMPIKGWNDFMDVSYATKKDELHQLLNHDNTLTTAQVETMTQNLITERQYDVVSGHLAEFSIDGGLYFHFPLSKRWAIGTKALLGSSVMQALDISAHYTGHQKTLLYDLTITNNTFSNLTVHSFDDRVGADMQPQTYDAEWDFFTLSGSRSMKYGAGLSVTYSHKGNFTWRAFVDYDYTNKTFTLTYDPYAFIRSASPEVYGLATLMNSDLSPKVYTLDRDLHRWVLGGAFNIAF